MKEFISKSHYIFLSLKKSLNLSKFIFVFILSVQFSMTNLVWAEGPSAIGVPEKDNSCDEDFITQFGAQNDCIRGYENGSCLYLMAAASPALGKILADHIKPDPDAKPPINLKDFKKLFEAGQKYQRNLGLLKQMVSEARTKSIIEAAKKYAPDNKDVATYNQMLKEDSGEAYSKARVLESLIKDHVVKSDQVKDFEKLQLELFRKYLNEGSKGLPASMREAVSTGQILENAPLYLRHSESVKAATELTAESIVELFKKKNWREPAFETAENKAFDDIKRRLLYKVVMPAYEKADPTYEAERARNEAATQKARAENNYAEMTRLDGERMSRVIENMRRISEAGLPEYPALKVYELMPETVRLERPDIYPKLIIDIANGHEDRLSLDDTTKAKVYAEEILRTQGRARSLANLKRLSPAVAVVGTVATAKAVGAALAPDLRLRAAQIAAGRKIYDCAGELKLTLEEVKILVSQTKPNFIMQSCSEVRSVNPKRLLAQAYAKFGYIPKGLCQIVKKEFKANEAFMNPSQFKDLEVTCNKISFQKKPDSAPKAPGQMVCQNGIMFYSTPVSADGKVKFTKEAIKASVATSNGTIRRTDDGGFASRAAPTTLRDLSASTMSSTNYRDINTDEQVMRFTRQPYNDGALDLGPEGNCYRFARFIQSVKQTQMAAGLCLNSAPRNGLSDADKSDTAPTNTFESDTGKSRSTTEPGRR